MPVTVTIHGAEEASRVLSRLEAGVIGRNELEAIGMLGVRSVQRGIREQRSPDGAAYKPVNRYGEGGQRLQDSNRLLNSITYEVDDSGGNGSSRVRVGTNVIYAPMQHFGGTQTATKAKYLAIPLTRQVARAVAGRGFRTAFPGAFVIVKNGQALLVRKKEDGEVDALAILKKSVRIEGTHFLGLSKEGERDIVAYVERVIARQIGDKP